VSDYAKVMEQTWDALYLAPEDAEAALCAAGAPPAGADSLVFELARRRRTVIRTLRSVYPVSFFSFYGIRGREGLLDFFASEPWRARPYRRNSAYPDTELSARAYDAYIRTKPLAEPHFWDSFHNYETALLFPERGVPTRDSRGYSIRPGSWIARCDFDAPAFADLVAQAAGDAPWEDVLWVVRPRPQPMATLSLAASGRIRRVVLRGEQYAALRPLWDGAFDLDLTDPVVDRAINAGLIAREEAMAAQ
jgi:hypothetical protein